jgi:hypothetical protein
MDMIAIATDETLQFHPAPDCMNAYNYAAEAEFDGSRDCAQLVKIYPRAEPEQARMYSPASLAGKRLPLPFTTIQAIK